MFLGARLKGLSINPDYIPLFKTNPRLFMSLIPDPSKCPDDIPPDIWKTVSDVLEHAAACHYPNVTKQLAMLADTAGQLVRVLNLASA